MRDAKNKVSFLLSHTPWRVRLERFARVRLSRHSLPFFFADFEKKPTVLQSTGHAPSRLASGEELKTSVAQKEKSK